MVKAAAVAATEAAVSSSTAVTDFRFEYSPESFTATELPFAAEVCNAVIDVWKPTREKPAVINLPATVEVSTPNVYADQVEWMCEHLDRRDAIRVSLHTHNDRGCGVAAAELATMAGADRVEGTLLGNGERTGNMDIVTMAMNLYSQGVDPKLNLGDMDRIISTVEACTQIPLHPRHAYAGDLVFTAFSGSHQDAIKKCLAQEEAVRDKDPMAPWDVAYLPIDPRDLGRNYQAVIRINSQSGKGGAAFILAQDYGIKLPPWLQVDFVGHVQKEAERSGKEVSASTIFDVFNATYLDVPGVPALVGYDLARSDKADRFKVNLVFDGKPVTLESQGSGVLDAFVRALSAHSGTQIVLVDYAEHTLGDTAEAEAMSYVQLNIDGNRVAGAGRSRDIIGASLAAILRAWTRGQRQTSA